MILQRRRHSKHLCPVRIEGEHLPTTTFTGRVSRLRDRANVDYVHGQKRRILAAAIAALFPIPPVQGATAAKVFRAGAYAADISPAKLPVVINGMFLSRTADRVTDPIHARCLVLDDGETRLAIVVVDSCMMPRELLDRAKEMASRTTGIPISP